MSQTTRKWGLWKYTIELGKPQPHKLKHISLGLVKQDRLGRLRSNGDTDRLAVLQASVSSVLV